MRVSQRLGESGTAREDRFFARVVVPFLLGALAATFGSYWDDAWHTNRGRDSFFIPPHVLIYGGVLIAGAGLGLWVANESVRRGTDEARRDRAVVLAAAGVCVTLVAAPIDNLWHATFGRDAVIWSPPHVLGILGLLSLSLAVLVLVSQRSGAWLAPTKALLGGAALTAVNFLVVEYETDVPQFNERYYLPVLALVSVVTFSLLRSANPGRWTATVAAGVQFLLVGLAAIFLLGVGWDAPLMPLLLGPAVVFDLGDRRRWPSPLRALAHAAVLY